MSERESDLTVFLPSLETLETFFLSVVNRTNEKGFKIVGIEKEFGDSELDILSSFSRTVRPILTRSRLYELPERKEPKIISWTRQIWQTELVTYATMISGIAAAVMLFGVSIFKVDASQAFLTWFGVTFGSLSISIGVASLRKSGGHNYSDKIDV